MRRIAYLTVFLLAAGPVRAQEDKVYKALSADQMESILERMKIQVKKVESKDQPGSFFYDFTRNNQNLRLHFYGGKDLMLDLLLPEHPLETLNRWNARAKFSRAAQHRDDTGPFTALESNLDLAGGVTEGAIRQFFRVFEEDALLFQNTVAPAEEKILEKVGDDAIERILAGLKTEVKKGKVAGRDDATYFDYESKGYKIRLTNFAGKDLMLDAVFKKLALEKVNQYNFDRKFIRAVLYKQGGQEYSTIEANFDCSVGVSESMIRHFLATFDEELKAYAEFLTKSK